VAVYEGNEPVTNIEAVIFESSSEKIEDRKKSITLVLQDRQYDKKRNTGLSFGMLKQGWSRRAWTLLLIGHLPMTSENGQDTLGNGLDELLNRHFAGRVVRKDLTKLVKEGANVPVYVLEYLLGQHCASNDEAIIQDGLKTVKRILAENYVRPDEAEKVKSIIRERGSLKIIDKATVKLNEKRDVYEAFLSNLGIKGVEIGTETVRHYEKLLAGGIWSINLHGVFL